MITRTIHRGTSGWYGSVQDDGTESTDALKAAIDSLSSLICYAAEHDPVRKTREANKPADKSLKSKALREPVPDAPVRLIKPLEPDLEKIVYDIIAKNPEGISSIAFLRTSPVRDSYVRDSLLRRGLIKFDQYTWTAIAPWPTEK